MDLDGEIRVLLDQRFLTSVKQLYSLPFQWKNFVEWRENDNEWGSMDYREFSTCGLPGHSRLNCGCYMGWKWLLLWKTKITGRQVNDGKMDTKVEYGTQIQWNTNPKEIDGEKINERGNKWNIAVSCWGYAIKTLGSTFNGELGWLKQNDGQTKFYGARK